MSLKLQQGLENTRRLPEHRPVTDARPSTAEPPAVGESSTWAPQQRAGWGQPKPVAAVAAASLERPTDVASALRTMHELSGYLQRGPSLGTPQMRQAASEGVAKAADVLTAALREEPNARGFESKRTLIASALYAMAGMPITGSTRLEGTLAAALSALKQQHLSHLDLADLRDAVPLVKHEWFQKQLLAEVRRQELLP